MTDLDSKAARTEGSARRPRPDVVEVYAMNDACLVAAIADGRQAAFEAAYHRHAGPVYALAARLCGADAARDVTQEVFLALWSAPERFDDQRGPLRSLLLTQAHGRAVDQLRAGTARRSREANTVVHPNHTPGVEREALLRLAGTEACNMLSALPAPTAEAIVVAFFAGYTYRQTADLLGQPEGTVKSRIRSGLTQLRTKLSVSEPPEAS